jgi:hypothetical protein
MKTTNLLALIAAVTSLTAFSALEAADRKAPPSPRAKANAPRAIAGETTETLDRSFRYTPPRATQEEASRKAIKANTPNALNRTLTGIAAKNKNNQAAKTGDLQIAPVK